MARVQIIPAILVYTFKDFEAKTKIFEQYFDIAQIDAMDAKFVPNKTFYSLNKIKKIITTLDYELHLMVNNPGKVIRQAIKYKKIKRIIFHIEAVNLAEADELIQIINKSKKQSGIAINPSTELDKIKPLLDKIDFILVMGVNPGFSSQKLNQNTYKRLKALRRLKNGLKISVDGGVNDHNARKLVKAGADSLTSASFLLQSKSIEFAIKKLSTA